MIDINELRRLAQAAMHPVTKGRWMRLFGERTVYDRMEDGCRGIPVVSTPVSPPHPFEAACLDFIAAANPAAVIEILDRLEAAESECLEQARLNGMGSEREAALMAKLEAAEKTNREWLRANAPGGWIDNLRIENEAMRAKIKAMERQEPAAWRTFDGEGGYDYRSYEDNENYKLGWDARNPNHIGWVEPLYALPGAKGE